MIREQPTERIVTQDALLRQKCRQALRHHRQWAKKDGATLDYGTLDLLELARSQQTCEYCHMPLAWDWQFDHRTPLARSAKGHRLKNLAIVCSNCNCAKGQLSELEYIDLLMYLRGIDPRGAADMRRRLIAGGASVYTRGRKKN